MDGHASDTGFPLTVDDQLRDNRFIARLAHERGLSVRLKNDLPQISALLDDFDFAVNEQCAQLDECDRLSPFIRAGKAVPHVEYELEPSAFCAQSRRLDLSSMRKRLDLDHWRAPVPDQIILWGGSGEEFASVYSRRSVLGAFTAASVAHATPAQASAARVLRAPVLRPGDRVRVVSPGSTPDPAQVERGVEILRSWGLTVELGRHVFDRYGYLAGRDEDRLADLQEALADPQVRGVFAARGGYGTQRIVDRLDLRPLRRHPKVVVGFSDITSLQARLWRACRLVTVHGPMVAWNDRRTGPESAEALRAAVMTTRPVVLTRDPAETTAPVMVPGRARGPLLGGNLTLVDAAIGARDFPGLRGAVFFFEEVGEAPYRIDRMLTHLRRSGALKGVRAIVIGQITGSDAEPGEWDAVGVLRDRLGDLGVPVLGGLRLGHGNGQLTVPLGAQAVVDAAAGTLTVEPAVAD